MQDPHPVLGPPLSLGLPLSCGIPTRFWDSPSWCTLKGSPEGWAGWGQSPWGKGFLEEERGQPRPGAVLQG